MNALQNAAYGGAGAYGGGYGYQPQGNLHNRFGGSSAGTGTYASNGGGSYTGGSTGSFAGVAPGGQVYGGTTGGQRPSYSSGTNYNSRPNYASSGGANFASAGGSVSSNGHSQQHAAVYPSNPVIKIIKIVLSF